MAGKIVVPYKHYFSVPVGHNYCHEHISGDYWALANVIDNQPENIRKAFKKIVIKGIKVSTFNMFIMRWDDFDAYCTWLFGVLGQVEQQIDTTGRDVRQTRV